MRGADHVGQAEKRAVGGRLNLEHVEARPRDMARFQRLGQSRLIDQPAARAVDDTYARFQLGDVLAAEDIGGLLGIGHMQGDEIGMGEQLLQLDLAHAHLLGLLLGEERIIGHDLHLEALGPVADDAADIARADHAKRLAGQLDPHEAGLLPFALMGRGAGLGNLPRHGEHHRDGVLGGGDHVAKGRVHHDHALLGGRDLVDIVGADPGAADDFQIGRGGEDLFRHLGGRADGEAVIVADAPQERVLVLAKGGFEIHLDAAIAEDLHGGFAEFVGYENFGGHGSGPFGWGPVGGQNCPPYDGD